MHHEAETTAQGVVVADYPDHAPFRKWLSSKGFDIALATMSLSAGSKKPGRVIERLRKKIKSPARGLRVVNWSKDDKFVYGYAHTQARLGDIILHEEAGLAGDWLDTNVLVQTDIYLRTQGDHTEGNAITVASISQDALNEAEAKGVSWKSAMAAARVFASALPDTGIAGNDPHEFLFPCEGGAVVAINLPIERHEHGERQVGHLLDIRLILGERELTAEMMERMEGLSAAMTKEGHPGAEAFATMVRSNAISLR